MKNKAASSFLKIGLSLILVICGSVYVYMRCVADESGAPDKELYEQVELFADAITIVQSDFVEEIEPKKLVYGALEGLLSSLDGYSHFMDPDDFKEMEIDTKGEFGGLGIEIGIRDSILTVIAPIDGTPAEKAGLKAGDRIVKIEGKLTRGLNLTDAVKKLRGKPNTKVTITVLREGEEKLLDFTIVRSIIKLKSIKTVRIIDKTIGYIKLIEFQERTGRELAKKISGLKKDGMEALILDLRNNPGGLLDASYAVSDNFLPEGKVVVSLKGRVPAQNKVYISTGKQSFTDFPMVVLVNKGSASASEIVAGAIQENQRGIILGTKTFGKGSVQTIIPLKDGSAVRLTTAAYYTPKGRSISNTGITPDVEVKLRQEKKVIEKTGDVFDKIESKEEEKEKKKEVTKEEIIYDNQMQAAIDMLRGILFYKQGKEQI
ncbi:MAG: S41 family peptidase [Omnitrophica bacterium]|nr:S41 family peptidase [Candidatus Omnitrophota bacterium]